MEFELVHRKYLSPATLEKHPVWVEYYEPTDIQLMASGGFDREKVEGALKKVGYSDDYLMPLINYLQPSPFKFTLYKSIVNLGDFELPSYLFVMVNKVNSLTIFFDDEKYTINFSYPDFGDDVSELLSKLGLSTIFPIAVSADIGINFEFVADSEEQLARVCSRLILASS